MKRLFSIFAAAMLLSLSACGNSNRPEPEDTPPAQSPDTTPAVQPSEPETAIPDAEGTTNGGGNVLVVYYSASGRTEAVAGYIADALGGDTFEIVPAEPYTSEDLDWTNEDSRVSREHDDPSLRTMELAADSVDNWDSYRTYAESTDLEGIAASRDHRAFGGFSMGSMNTWRTFEHCLDYFRYFAPSSGGPIGSGEAMADIVRSSGHAPEDFFIFTASGTEDFAYSGFKSGVMAMGETAIFTLAGSEQEGNLSFREREGYAHDGNAANEYMYNALRFFWNRDSR